MCEGGISRAGQIEQKRAYWKEQIDRWRQSGLSQAEYCRRHDLVRHQMAYWKKRLQKPEPDVSFFPVELNGFKEIASRPEQTPLFLVIGNDFKIEINEGFDAQVLRQLIFLLQALA